MNGILSALTFDVGGRVRARLWDRIAVPGVDAKGGIPTRFDVETLGQMVDNFLERGDPLPLDHDHQSHHAAANGRPAPALAWYGALAVVDGGKIVKLGTLPLAGVVSPPQEGCGDGLWGFRFEVTPTGQELLPNYKLLSPTFNPEGTRRDGSPCGYSLYAVAATNSPWQSGTLLAMGALPNGASQPQRRKAEGQGQRFLIKPSARLRMRAAIEEAPAGLSDLDPSELGGYMTERQAQRFARLSELAVEQLIDRNVRRVV